MEWLWEQVTATNAVLFLLFSVLLNRIWEIYDMRHMPPGPRLLTSIPFLGNFLSFNPGSAVEGRSAIAEHTRSLREKYGKVFTVKLGCWKVVFASSVESVKEVLVKRSGDFAGRPPFESFTQQTLGGKNIIFGQGNAWKLHRKLFMTALRQYLNDPAVVQERITEQVRVVLQYFDSQHGQAFDPGSILTTAVARITGSISFGKDFISSTDFNEVLDGNEKGLKNFKDRQLLTLLDAFPALAKYAPVSKRYKEICDYGYGVIRRQLQQKSKSFDPSQPVKDLISGLLKAKSEASYESKEERTALLSDEHLICTLEDMFAAGYDTTSATLRWAISFLVNYPQYQTDIQQQIDNVIGRDRLPGLDDRPSLPLVDAAIMESLRIGNVSDMAIPHYTLKDTTLCGYRVPKDTVVIVDLESVHLDPKCWHEPLEFDPQRHLDANGNVITNQENYLVFSAGRRMCAGEMLAKAELFLFLAIMLHQYSFVPAEGEPLPDLEGVRGINHYPKPYKICAVKRQ